MRKFLAFSVLAALAPASALAAHVGVKFQRAITGTSFHTLEKRCERVEDNGIDVTDGDFKVSMEDDFGEPYALNVSYQLQGVANEEGLVVATVKGGFLWGKLVKETVIVDTVARTGGYVDFFSKAHYEKYRIVLGNCE
jgi:hypothetical protein